MSHERREYDRFGNVIVYVGGRIVRVEPLQTYGGSTVGPTSVFTSGLPAEALGLVAPTIRISCVDHFTISAPKKSTKVVPRNRHERRSAARKERAK